jgi:hypothetical protein
MAIQTYSELKTAIFAWVDSSSGDFSGTTIDDLILMAHQRIGREVRCREMEADISATVSAGVVPLPADFVDLKYAYLNNEQPTKFLQKRTARFIYERYPHRDAAGRPGYVAREGSNFIFGPYPDTGTTYNMKGVYWRRMTLTTTLTFNEVVRVHPDLYLAASVAEAIPFVGQDARLQVWEAKYQQIRNDLLNEVNTEGYEGSEVEF